MTAMIEAIKNRKSIGIVKKDIQPEKEQIEQILEAGRWAPNHYRTEPWRFVVLEGEGRDKLAQALADIETDGKGVSADEKEQAREKGLRKAHRAPTIIVVIAEPKDEDHVEWVEEVEACACAAQNMLLAAASLGLAAKWRTGKAAYHERMKELFNISDKGMVVAFIYIGYPDVEPKKRERKPLSEIVEWWRE